MKSFIGLSILFILSLSSICMAADKTILVIESYHAEYAWDVSYKEGLEEILGKNYNLEYFEMDTKRVPSSEYTRQAELAFKKYQKTDPVLVILGDDNALKLVGPKLAQTNTPVVYLGINQNPRNYKMFGPENVTGVLERPLMKRSVLILKEILKPEPKKILILFDTGATSKSSVEQVFRGKNTTYIDGVQTDLKFIGNIKEWKKTVLSSKESGYDAIIVGLYHTITDDYKMHVDSGEILEWTSENTPVPPFCFWDFTAGPDKTIGGLVLFGKIQGQTAGKIALNILSGTKPFDIKPVVAEKGRLMFSKEQIEKWNITLPEDMTSKVEFTE